MLDLHSMLDGNIPAVSPLDIQRLPTSRRLRQLLYEYDLADLRVWIRRPGSSRGSDDAPTYSAWARCFKKLARRRWFKQSSIWRGGDVPIANRPAM